MQVDAPKAADHNGYHQTLRPSRGMPEGLKNQNAITRKDLRVEHSRV